MNKKVEGKVMIVKSECNKNSRDIIVTKLGFIDIFKDSNLTNKEIPGALLNTKILREMSSLVLYGDDRIISTDEFYIDNWDISGISTDKFNIFIRDIYNIKSLKNTYIRNDNELIVFGLDKNSKFLIKSYILNNHDDLDIYLLKDLIDYGVAPVIIECILITNQYKLSNKPLYNHFKIKQANNKIRDIYAPQGEIKHVLRNLLAPLNKAYNNRTVKSKQFAYIEGCSIKNNVEIHKDNKYVVKTDISSFFDQCNWELAKKYLGFLVPRERQYVLNDIKDLIINPETNGLYMGSPVSGVLSNMILRPAVIYLENIFKEKDIKFSVYADDLTVSSNKPLSKMYVVSTIEYVFNKYKLPFVLKESKTKSLINNGRRITGIRINHLDQMTMDRSKYKLIRSIFDRLEKGKEITMNQSQLLGRLNYYLFIDESKKLSRLCYKYNDVLIKNKIFVNLQGQIFLDENNKFSI